MLAAPVGALFLALLFVFAIQEALLVNGVRGRLRRAWRTLSRR